MQFLNDLVTNSQYALFTAFLLGLITAISPCPLAMNITAIGYIGKNFSSKRKVFFSGLMYTLGRVFSYTAIGIIIYAGTGTFKVSKIFQTYGEKVLGPLLVLIGILMFDFIHLRLPSFNHFSERFEKKGKINYSGSFFLGLLFALAFCPYSGILYFGMLIPLTISTPQGLILPPVYAIATGLPVIIFAWLLAFMVDSVGKIYDGIRNFEKWMRKIVAILFIITGLYYMYIFFI